MYENGELSEFKEEIIITKKNSYSIQNEGDPFPSLTLAMDKHGNLMLNINSASHILKKAKEIQA